MAEKWKQFEKRKWLLGSIVLILVVCAVGGAAKVWATDESVDSQSQADTAQVALNIEQEETLEQIKATYDTDNQLEIKARLEQQKLVQKYTIDNMLIEYNPFGTNTQSLYVYFQTDTAMKAAYTVQTDVGAIEDFSRDIADGTYNTTHEFQVIGLVPNSNNTILFTLTKEDGTQEIREYMFEMGSVLGTEEVQLERTVTGNEEELSDGLYAILGNDSTKLDFMYYYDNQGVLRGEVPLIGYRSHRIITNGSSIYYSISETKMAQVDPLGQVLNVFSLGQYELHHDYVFDNEGNMLILASDTQQDSIEDIIVKLDTSSGEVTKVLDLADLFGEYKATCTKNADDELDWMHINTLQWIADESLIISSRETSTIIKIEDIYSNPEVAYLIGSKEFWEGSGYEALIYEQEGDFTLQGGQHTVTYEEDDSLIEGQYYLYMFNNNIGMSQSQPDFDWSAIGLSQSAAKDGVASYYYRYLVDENNETFELVESIEVPYSGYVSSAQKVDDNIVINSGFQGLFGEYDENNELIVSFQMQAEKFIYRVYKI